MRPKAPDQAEKPERGVPPINLMGSLRGRDFEGEFKKLEIGGGAPYPVALLLCPTSFLFSLVKSNYRRSLRPSLKRACVRHYSSWPTNVVTYHRPRPRPPPQVRSPRAYVGFETHLRNHLSCELVSVGNQVGKVNLRCGGRLRLRLRLRLRRLRENLPCRLPNLMAKIHQKISVL